MVVVPQIIRARGQESRARFQVCGRVDRSENRFVRPKGNAFRMRSYLSWIKDRSGWEQN